MTDDHRAGGDHTPAGPIGHLVPPAFEEFRKATADQIMRAFGVMPWSVGLAPYPARFRAWGRLLKELRNKIEQEH